MAVRLLFDQNLAPRLVAALVDLYPDCLHVATLGLAHAGDEEVWSRAAELGLVIVSKDADFHQMSFLRGHPPKVVWIRRGNCSTDEIADVLREHHADLERFAADPDAAFLVLG